MTGHLVRGSSPNKIGVSTGSINFGFARASSTVYETFGIPFVSLSNEEPSQHNVTNLLIKLFDEDNPNDNYRWLLDSIG